MNASRPRSRGARDGGSVTLEVAILAPALLALLGLLVIAGRVSVARSAVEYSAIAAARDASLARTAEGARSRAGEAAARELAAQSARCTDVGTAVDTAGFSVPVGQPAFVEVTVTCTVNLADLALPGLPGAKTITASFVSALDAYRARP